MTPKHGIIRHLIMRLASRCKRRRQRRPSFDTIQANPSVGNAEDVITGGYHGFPGGRSMDRVVKNAPYPYDLGWQGRLMEGRTRGQSEDDEENVEKARFGTRNVEAEDGTEMRSMKERGGKKEEDCKSTSPAATCRSRECGEQASTQSLQQRQQQQQPPRSRINSARNVVMETVHLSDPLQASTDMATAKIPDPTLRRFPDAFVTARKPVLRKPVPNITETANSDVKNTALEAFLLLFALGAFGAFTLCFVVMELLSRW